MTTLTPRLVSGTDLEPRTSAKNPAPDPTLAEPVLTRAHELVPDLEGTVPAETTGPEPTLTSTEPLHPVIRSVEEE